MLVKYEKLFTTKEELEIMNRTDPNMVAGLLIHTICNYNPNDTTEFYKMLQFLMGENQTISALMQQNIKDRMLQNEKYPYIGKSYFKGATPDNDYTPTSYEVEVVENEHSRVEEGYIRLFLKSGGSDSLRPITLRLAKDGNYYVWSDSVIGLLADIRIMESKNPWA